MSVKQLPHVRRSVLASASILAFVVAGCGSDNTDSAVTTVAEHDMGTATTSPTDPVTSTTETPLPMGDIVATALTNHVFTELAGLAVDAGLVETLRGGPFTVFAPTDAAFAKVPVDVLHTIQDDADTLATVLTHHVIAGAIAPDQLAAGELTTVAGTTLTVTEVDGKFYVEGNEVGAGVEATNGYVYVMNDVLVPALGDIIDVATTLPGFATLADLVTRADLIDTLKGDGPFTVFAPVDSAFEALAPATLNAVLGDADLLATVLTYHVVSGAFTTEMLEPGTLTTVAGVELTITKQDGVTYVDGNPILVQNVRATNGVIHVLGAVLVPQT
ncbi:MAG: fasciclin domain-containing protein [Actinobacteria bacterium]|nr:fasciclin domain-containing protein [Actinomycetota bacterium]